jgi:hypothetical protein
VQEFVDMKAMIQMIDGNKFFDFGGTLAAQCHPIFINRHNGIALP